MVTASEYSEAHKECDAFVELIDQISELDEFQLMRLAGPIEQNVMLKVGGVVQKCPNCKTCNVFSKYSETIYACNACETWVETE